MFRMYASNSHSYTHLILALGIVREPTVWVFITSKYPGIHDIGRASVLPGRNLPLTLHVSPMNGLAAWHLTRAAGSVCRLVLRRIPGHHQGHEDRRDQPHRHQYIGQDRTLWWRCAPGPGPCSRCAHSCPGPCPITPALALAR